jgi:hypothetical protein
MGRFGCAECPHTPVCHGDEIREGAPSTALRGGDARGLLRVFGPVDKPPWKRQRAFPGSTRTPHGLPRRLRAPQTGRSLRGKGERLPLNPSARNSRQSAPILQRWFEQACGRFDAGQTMKPERCQLRQASADMPLPPGGPRATRRSSASCAAALPAINEGRFNGRRVPNRPIPANLRNFLWMYRF